jgi:hypothetical protein
VRSGCNRKGIQTGKCKVTAFKISARKKKSFKSFACKTLEREKSNMEILKEWELI